MTQSNINANISQEAMELLYNKFYKPHVNDGVLVIKRGVEVLEHGHSKPRIYLFAGKQIDTIYEEYKDMRVNIGKGLNIDVENVNGNNWLVHRLENGKFVTIKINRKTFSFSKYNKEIEG